MLLYTLKALWAFIWISGWKWPDYCALLGFKLLIKCLKLYKLCEALGAWVGGPLKTEKTVRQSQQD